MLIWKAIKIVAITTGSAAALGGLVFGTELTSYLRSSANSMTSIVKDNIPIDFQLRRARDLLDASGPEMRKNVRLMAEQEVDIATLKSEITQARQSLEDEKLGLQKLRDTLATQQNSFSFGDITYTREQMTQELSHRFSSYKQAELAQDQRKSLLESREKALAAAMQAMDTARAQRVALQSQIEALDGRYRLVQATATETGVQVDNSQLAQAEKVVGDVQHQLDVSERVLAQEAKFTHSIAFDVIDEKSLIGEVDAHLAGRPSPAAVAAAAALTDASQDPIEKSR
ncbi:MAG: hypothetical protein M3O30_16695 [Planctomycetota bacterium]|nr:hypothetical protein [Planctomycetota bacterium]